MCVQQISINNSMLVISLPTIHHEYASATRNYAYLCVCVCPISVSIVSKDLDLERVSSAWLGSAEQGTIEKQ